MKPKPEHAAKVDKKGRLIIPAQIAAGYGLQPGASVSLQPLPHGIYVRQPVTYLKKIYIEPTTHVCAQHLG